MTLTDLISKRGISHPMESFSQQTPKKRPKLNRSNKFHQNGKFKKLQTSVLDLLHVHHPMDNLENKDIHHQQQEPLPPHPSIIKSSDIARVLSKKSVTFASVFDPGENKDDVVRRFLLQLIKSIFIRLGISNQLLRKKWALKRISLLLSHTTQSMIR